MKRFPLFFMALTTCLLMTLATMSCESGSRSPARQLPDLGELDGFNLTERSGKMIDLSELKGKVWIADFIFTRCQGPCPILSSKMAGLQEDLKAFPEVKLVSFSVDPLSDTPEVLSEYARRYHADPDRWLFLTGPVESVYHLISEGFKLPVSSLPPPDKIVAGDFITHTTRFIVVDQRGHIRRYVDSQDERYREEILEAVKSLELYPPEHACKDNEAHRHNSVNG